MEIPKFEKENIVSVICKYCYEDILFEIPEYQLKMGPFPIHLVSSHGDPAHDFSIEVFENREVKIVKQEAHHANFTHQKVQQPEIPLLPEKRPQGETRPVLKVPIKTISMETPPLLEVHNFPHLAPNKPEESPAISPPDQPKNTPSPNFPDTIQENPAPQAIQENEDRDPIRQMKDLMQKLPQLTREEIAEEISGIALYFMQKSSLSKVASEIRNWSKDILRMEWNDTQVRALTHQLKFWSEKLSQLA